MGEWKEMSIKLEWYTYKIEGAAGPDLWSIQSMQDVQLLNCTNCGKGILKVFEDTLFSI